MDSSRIDIKKARKSALIGTLIFLVIGTLQLWKDHPRFAIIAYVLCAIFFVLGVTSPKTFLRVTHGIGEVITKALLFVVFYFFITPIGLVMRLFKRDPLAQRIERGKDSYWIKKESNKEDIASYEKQY